MTLEERDGSSLLMHGSMAGAATKILFFSDNGRAYTAPGMLDCSVYEKLVGQSHPGGTG